MNLFWRKKTQRIANGQGNVQSNRDTNINQYFNLEQEDVLDLGAINEIFDHVIQECGKTSEREINDDGKLIFVEDKILLNFEETDINEVKTYFTYAYTKISLVSNEFIRLDEENQKDINSFIYTMYIKLKDEKKGNIYILRRMFENVIPKDKINNPQYANIAKAFILFFFDDCTIFEKTEKERKKN